VRSFHKKDKKKTKDIGGGAKIGAMVDGVKQC